MWEEELDHLKGVWLGGPSGGGVLGGPSGGGVVLGGPSRGGVVKVCTLLIPITCHPNCKLLI